MTINNHFEPQDIGKYTLLLEIVTHMTIDYHLHSVELYENKMKNPNVKMVNLIRNEERQIQ